MAQFAKQREGLMKIQQLVQRVRPGWLGNPAAHHGTKGASPLPTESLHLDVAPDALTQLRDDELLGLIGQGNVQALGALYDRHSALVFSLALHIIRSQLVAEELTQDVFQIIWQHAHAFQGGTGLDSDWIVGIARASALEKIGFRQARSRTRNTALDITPIPTLQAGAKLERAAGFRDDVRAALAALPAEQRQALELAHYGGLTTREMAASLATSEGVVKTRLRLGLRNLADVLQLGVTPEEHDR